MFLARTALGFALASALASVVACSAAPDSAKKPLPVCDAKDPDCPGVPASSNKTHGEIPTDPVPAPPQSMPVLPPEPSSTSDSGADAADAAPKVGPQCAALGACCKQLGDAGYVTTTCNSVLSTNNEDACYTQHASYKTYGDCS